MSSKGQVFGFWIDYPTAEAILFDKLINGKSITVIAEEMSAEFNKFISVDIVSKKIRKMGRPPLKEGATAAHKVRLDNTFWGRFPESLPIIQQKYENGEAAERIALWIQHTYKELVTRNAVIGKMVRLNSAHGSKEPPKPPRPKRAPTPRPPPMAAVTTKRPPTPVIETIIEDVAYEPLSLAIWDLPDNRACRWIISGDPGEDVMEVRYCGCTAEQGQSYCSHHRKIGEAAPVPRTRPKPFYRAAFVR